MEFTTTDKGQIRSEMACLLYDPENGAILHVHRVVTFKGAEEWPVTAIEERTRQLATNFGLEAERLKSLIVDGKKLKPEKDYRVDPKKQRLVSSKREVFPAT